MIQTNTSKGKKKITLNTREQRNLWETENPTITGLFTTEQKGVGYLDTGKSKNSIRQRRSMSFCVLGNFQDGSRENLDL